jgi:hypothetical protein
LIEGPIVRVSARGLDLLGRLAPELTGGEIFQAVGHDVDDAVRFELATAAIEVLRQAGEATPTVVVLEDLHAADDPSLRLLAMITPHLDDLRVAVLATYRPQELTADARGVLGRLVSVAERLDLSGLSDDEIGIVIATVAGAPVHPTVAEAIVRLAGGNPLFAREVTRLLRAEGRLGIPLAPDEHITVPTEIADVVRRRVSPLPEAVAETVHTAAVMGSDFDVATVSHVIGVEATAILGHLEVAAGEGLVDEIPGSVGRFRFHHVLQRNAIYDELPGPVRIELHRRVADALEAMHAADVGPYLSQLSHHLFACALVVDADRVADVARRAGDRALRLLAFEEAALQFQRALDVLESSGDPRLELRCDLLLALADARRRGGDVEARATSRTAADLARSLGDAARLAQAALGMQAGIGMIGTLPVTDRELVQHLEEALAELPDEDTALRAHALSVLAEEVYWSSELERADCLSRDALDMARRLGNETVLGRALIARAYAIWSPDSPEERVRLTTETLHIAERVRNPELAFMARALAVGAHFELGDLAAVDREMKAVEALYEELRQPLVRWAIRRWQASRALLEAKLDDAERLIGEAAEIAQEVQEPEAVLQYFGTQMWQVLHDRLTLADLEPVIRERAEAQPHVVSWRAALAFILAWGGKAEEALHHVEYVLSSGVPRDMTWHTTIGLMCRTAAALGHSEHCARLHDLTAPYADRCVVIGDGTLYGGAVAHWSGICAWKAGRTDAAEQMIRQGEAVNARMGARAFLAHSRRDHALLLAERGTADDLARAGDLLAQALATYRECTLRGFAELTARELDTISESLDHTNASTPGNTQQASLHRDGDRWVVGLGGRSASLPDLKGLSYLARLVAQPGIETHVLELASTRTGKASTSHEDGLAVGSGDAGSVLDQAAKTAYRRRLEELAEDLAEAEQFHDPERVARAQSEIDAITEQLAAAVGLGGRDRRAASDAERARMAVTKAIRTAVDRIGEHVPELAGHLRASVHTGTYCRYQPDPATQVVWKP